MFCSSGPFVVSLQKFLIMIQVCALASGSNGNCYYIGNHDDAVLIDVGLSCKQILKRFDDAGLDVSRVKAIFISHEHTDHVSGVKVLSKKLRIPVFLTRGTYHQLPDSSRPQVFRFIEPENPVEIGTLQVFPFSKKHDAAEPCSFRVEAEGKSYGVLTDLGSTCDHSVRHIKKCHVLFLESNYDEKMLWEGSYPWPLKKRIASIKASFHMQALRMY